MVTYHLFKTMSSSCDSKPIDTVVSDFNGTIAKKDLAKLILSRFAKPGWERYDQLFASGKISFKECFSKEYSMLQADSEEEIIGYIHPQCNLREGFKGFSQYCAISKIKLIIASKGLDFCLKYALLENEIDPPAIYSPKARFIAVKKKWEVTFPNLQTRGFHNFKDALVHSLKRKSKKVAFIGDDAYDFWAAERSDQIFAVRRSGLEQECVRNSVSCIPFESFKEILSFI
jgi:2-hydroxy-3-keto-5-methylthiopentenyl-1-phosphate phosphatase